MKTVFRVKVYEGDTDHLIEVKKKYDGAPYEVRYDGHFWATCENQHEANEEVKGIIDLYQLSFVPAI